MALKTVAVVGASLAGLRAVETLRRDGYDGRIVLIGAEPTLPYDRPPLSKQLLAGEVGPDDIVLRRASYDDLDLELRLGTRAVSLDLAGSSVSLDDGGQVAFDGIVLATGSAPPAASSSFRRSESAIERSTWTPSSVAPSTGGRLGTAPVAITSRS